MDDLQVADEPNRRTSLAKIAGWLGSGLLLSTFVLSSARVLRAAMVDPRPAATHLVTLVVGVAFWAAVGGILLLPLAFPALVGWTRLARRWNAMDRNWAVLILSLLILAVILSLVAGAVSNWERIMQPGVGAFWASTVDTALDVFPGAAVGLLLPRFLFRSFRLGAFTQAR